MQQHTFVNTLPSSKYSPLNSSIILFIFNMNDQNYDLCLQILNK